MELTKWLTYSKCRVYLQAVVVFKKLKITETSEKQDYYDYLLFMNNIFICFYSF